MVEIEELVNKLKWELTFLNDAFPDMVREALDIASADLGLLEVNGDETLTLDGAFTQSRAGMEAFLNNLSPLFHLVDSPFSGPVSRSVMWITGKLGRDANFERISNAWLATRDDEIGLFEPVDVDNVALSIRGTQEIADKLVKAGPRRRFGFDCEVPGSLENLKDELPILLRSSIASWMW